MTKPLRFALAFLLLALICLSRNASAAQPTKPSAVLAPYVNDDTFAVAQVNIAAMAPSQDHEAILSPQILMALKYMPADAQAQIFLVAIADSLARKFHQAGGEAVYVVAGLNDIKENAGPVLIATARPGQHIEEVEQFLRDLVREKDLKHFEKSLDVQRTQDVVLFGMKATVARYAKLKASDRKNLVDPVDKLATEGAVASLVFCPGPDFRRVVRELWPELPGPLAPMKGELADRWIYLEAAINAAPKLNPRLALVTSDPEAALLFVKLWNGLPEAVTQFGGNEQSKQQVRTWAQLFVSALPAKAEKNRVTINVPTGDDNIARLRSMFTAAVHTANESSNRAERMNRFKQITIGMNNFYDVYKMLPPQAIRDKEGKPLLSWRVAILPYVDQDKLYKQFHLDEPWDSPHNRTLIEKMPGVYMDLGPGSDASNATGKTTYQVPVGPKTAFYSHGGTKFSEVEDGTANTILLVEVEPSRAVAWTKPEDWEADLEQPKKGLIRSDRKYFTAGFADGHVTLFDLDKTNDAKLRSLLTRAGHDNDNER